MARSLDPSFSVMDAFEREALLTLLRASHESERTLAAYQLRRLVSRAAREMSGETFGRFEDELFVERIRTFRHRARSLLEEGLRGHELRLGEEHHHNSGNTRK